MSSNRDNKIRKNVLPPICIHRAHTYYVITTGPTPRTTCVSLAGLCFERAYLSKHCITKSEHAVDHFGRQFLHVAPVSLGLNNKPNLTLQISYIQPITAVRRATDIKLTGRCLCLIVDRTSDRFKRPHIQLHSHSSITWSAASYPRR